MRTRQKPQPGTPTQGVGRKESVRLTAQRRAILRALRSTCNHPTAKELHELTKRYLPGVSLATIYNTLQALQDAGMVNEHRLSSGAARFCINKTPHMHLVDEESFQMVDVHLRENVRLEDVFDLPPGATISHMSAYLYGTIPM